MTLPRFTQSLSIQWFHRIATKFAFWRANGATFLRLGPSLWALPYGEKKCDGTPSLKRANGAINMKIALVPPC